MTVYYLLFAALLATALLMHGERKGNIKFIYLAMLMVFCVYGLRDAYSVGVDSTTSYLVGFKDIADKEWSEMPTLSDWFSNDGEKNEEFVGRDRNIANDWLMKLVSDLTDGDYQIYTMVVAAFVTLAWTHFIRRFSPSPVQSILYYFGLLYFTLQVSALKQSLAMAVILFSFDAVVDRKLLRFLILVWIASLFHFPALVFLPAYWISNLKLEKSYLIFLAALFLITYLFRDRLAELMTDTYYDTAITEHSSMRFLANKVIVMIVIIVAALIIRPPSADDRRYGSLLMLIGVSAVIQTFAGYSNIFERLADYYFQFAVVFIPMIFEDVKTKRKHLSQHELRLVRKVGPYLFCAFAIWRFLSVTADDPALNQYQFYFQAEKTAESMLSGRFL